MEEADLNPTLGLADGLKSQPVLQLAQFLSPLPLLPEK
jgi:hypothetical protein